MLQYLDDFDISNVKRGIIIHGVNTLGKMGAGLAKSLRKKYPVMYQEYLDKCISYKSEFSLLGECIVYTENDTWGESPDFAIIGVFSQAAISRTQTVALPNKIYDGLFCAGEQIRKLGFTDDVEIYMPRIGCNLGGLNWKKDVEYWVKCFDIAYCKKRKVNICDYDHRKY